MKISSATRDTLLALQSKVKAEMQGYGSLEQASQKFGDLR
jgi:hypothetical protein